MQYVDGRFNVFPKCLRKERYDIDLGVPSTYFENITSRPTWDDWEFGDGYKIDGGQKVVCAYIADCRCEDYWHSGEQDTCMLDDPTADVSDVPVPSLDINSVCPEVFE